MAELKLVGDDGGGKKPGSFVLTPTTEAIFAVFDRCAEHSQVGLVIGWPGVGKSTAVRAYQLREAGVFAIRALRVAASKSAFLSLLCEHFEIEFSTTPNVYSLHKALIKKLAFEEPPLLIIDEANHLQDHTLEVLRDIIDEAGIGVVMLGNVELSHRLKRVANRYTSGSLPLVSRITYRFDIEEITREDLAAVARHHGLVGPACDFLLRVSKQGGLRTVTAVLHQAYSLSEKKAPGLQQLKDAASLIGMQV